MTDSTHIREADVSALVSTANIVSACDQAFRLYGQNQLLNPPRLENVQHTDKGDYFRLELPAEWPDRFRCRKVIEEHSDVATGTLGGRQALIHLEDLQNGKKIQIDADLLTDMRTGAAGALGLSYLAQRPITRVGIVGTGRIARQLARALDEVFTLEALCVTSRKEESRNSFNLAMAPVLKSTLHMAPSLRQCIDGADALLLAVPTPRPIITREDLHSDLLLAVIGGDSRTRQLAPDILETMPLMVDHLEQAKQSGEFLWALEQNRFRQIRFSRTQNGEVIHIGDAACGRLDEADERPRLAYFTGMGIQDLCAAVAVYQAIKTF
jgi:ornithine cyclodeaminase/alanine dehydrogenase-like protein (mu-crystallin family)